VGDYYSSVAAERLAFDDAARLERLKYTVEQARGADFYKPRLAGVTIRSLADLKDLPLTRKADLKGNPAEAFLACDPKKVWHFHESFGTTGRPVCGWYSLGDIECEIDVIGRWLQHFGPGQVVMNRYPYAFPVPAQLVETGVRLKGGTLIPTSNLTYNVGMPRVLRLMEQRQVNVITGMPLEAVLLKEAALLQGKDPATDFPDLQAFCFAGRILTPSWRETMMTDWNCAVQNLYGSTEGGPFATSDETGQLILHDEFFLFEVLDPETLEPLAGDDVVGGLCLTTLGREAQPMVRYYTEDLVRVRRREDGKRTIEVLGRAGDLIDFRGTKVTNFDLEEEILCWSKQYGANVFFVVITDKGFLVRVEFPEPGKVDKRDGEKRLSERLGVPVKLEVLPRGRLVNHVSLVTSAAVFKPRTVSDHRVEERKIINLSGALVDFWVDFTPKLVGQFVWKAVLDFVSKWRIRLLE
jgi:phenylacetate-CoA ligase